jgi:hypothetical protein
VTRALIEAANDAGGKDNVTAVYVEGTRFADGEDTGAVRRSRSTASAEDAPRIAAGAAPRRDRAGRGRTARLATIVLLLTGLLGWSAYHSGDFVPTTPTPVAAAAQESTINVQPGESISAAIERAAAGTLILVEPGEYREQVRLKSGVHLRSRLPREASLRLPGTAAESDAAVVAIDVLGAELRGFRIVGDAATPLGTGVSVQQSDLVMIDLEIQGARRSAVIFGTGASGGLLASDLRDNPGIGLDIRSGAAPRIVSNTFARNATTRSAGTIIAEPGARPVIEKNVFVGVTAQSIAVPLGAQGAAVVGSNWFVPAPRPAARGGRQGRQ